MSFVARDPRRDFTNQQEGGDVWFPTVDKVPALQSSAGDCSETRLLASFKAKLKLFARRVSFSEVWEDWYNARVATWGCFNPEAEIASERNMPSEYLRQGCQELYNEHVAGY